jgi:hypothetical protein
MDIEGGEIELMGAMFPLLEEPKVKLTQFLVEFHLGKLNENIRNGFAQYKQWTAQLKKHFPVVICRDPATLGKKWGTQIFCYSLVGYAPPTSLN